MNPYVCKSLRKTAIVFLSVVFFPITVYVRQVMAQESNLTFAMKSTFRLAALADTLQGSYSMEGIPDTTTEQTKGYLPRWHDMFTRLPGDWMKFTTESFQRKNILLMIGIGGLTAGLMAVDNPLSQNERKWYDRSLAFRNFSNDMVWAGDGRVQFGIVSAFAAYGFAFNNDRALRTASQITEAILASGTVVQLFKHLSGRERPDVASEIGGDWTFFPSQISYLRHVPHYDSFPSGHITTATTTLVVIAENYPELTWFKPASYLVLGAVSSSLVAYGIHWWSDIPLGIVLGYSFGEIASHPLSVSLGSKPGSESPSLSFEPVMLQDGVGVGVGLSF
jgi:membrane-associated phospholipid phosphatase